MHWRVIVRGAALNMPEGAVVYDSDDEWADM
jgi:hypothetical protein